MQDIKSTIRIEDGFTQPLKDLSQKAFYAKDVVSDFKDAISDASETLNEDFNDALTLSMQTSDAFGKTWNKITKEITGNFYKYKNLALRSDIAKTLLTKELRDAKLIFAKDFAKEKIDNAIGKSVGYIGYGIELSKREILKKTEAVKAAANEYKKLGIQLVDVEKQLWSEARAEKLYANFLVFNKGLANTIGAGVKSGAKNGLIHGVANTIYGGILAKNYTKEFAASGFSKFQDVALKAAMRLDDFFDKHMFDSKKVINLFESDGLKAAMKKAGSDFGSHLKDGFKSGLDFFKRNTGMIKDFALEFGKIMGLTIIQNIAFSLFKKIKDKAIELFASAREVIQNSLDDISLSDKFTAMYGKRGEVARDRAYALANQIGENSSMVSQLAMNSSIQGIGTKDFERVMHLADKIGKLHIGETTESAASNLLSNIKSGHDAGSLSQLLGGGQMMERQIRRSGFERALNRGDLNTALSIAEKITEQAGFTEEKYQKATKSMSEQYKKIENFVTNIKHKLSQIYAEEIEPIVTRVAEFIESPKFQKTLKFIEFMVRKIGSFVRATMEWFIDNINLIGGIFLVGIVAKTILIIKNAGAIFTLSKFILGIVGRILVFLGAKGIGGALMAVNFKLLRTLALSKLIAVLQIAGPWLAALVPIGIFLGVLYKITGQGKSFIDWLKGSVAGAARLLSNLFHNLAVAVVEQLPLKFKKAGLIIQAIWYSVISTLESVYYSFAVAIFTVMKNVLGDTGSKLLKEKFGIDLDANIKNADKLVTGNSSALKLKEITKSIEEIDKKLDELPYIDALEGVEDAFNSNGKTFVDWLKKLFKQGEEQKTAEQGTQTNTDLIRRQNEQEDELRWLKAFSDRQIMSSYNSMTSNVRNLTINGMSQAGMAEVGRRNLSTMPTRSAS